MKLKKTISAVLAAFALIAASSCEDMLKVDSKTVLYDYENTLNRPTDTVYSVLGIVKNIQKIADRTVILGEIRGDLVAKSDHANRDLAALYEYHLQDLKSNKYNNPTDYYAVINNCNYFLAHADTSLWKDRKNVFIKEYLSVLSYRAWTYLQLAQAYGEVYFVDQPILSGDQADEKKWPLLNIKDIATLLLADFERDADRYLAITMETPDYGQLGGKTGDGQQSTKHTSKEFFIPARVIMGDLALWSEQYEKAAKYYSDFLIDNENPEPRATTSASVLWFGNDWTYLDPQGDTYASTLGEKAEPICYIPMEPDEFSGVVSDLPNIFNSTKDNDYWYQLTRSKSLTSLSQRQNYCFHYINPQNESNVRPQYMPDKLAQDEELLRGDLRLQSILTVKTRKTDEFSSSKLNTSEQKLIKINPEKIWLYRNDVVYLRLAEALNRAEMPEMAFTVLKSGLSWLFFETSISRDDKLKLASYGIDTLFDYFEPIYYEIEDPDPNTNASRAKRTIQNVVVNRYNTTFEKNADGTKVYGNTMGIHSRGCGDAKIDTTYTIDKKLVEMGINPAAATLKDSIRAVEEFIIDEMALETCFEGYRFGDLMRIAMHRAADNGGGFAENDFLARRVASRESATMDNPWAGMDAELYDLLNGDGKSLNPNWFLKLTDK